MLAAGSRAVARSKLRQRKSFEVPTALPFQPEEADLLLVDGIADGPVGTHISDRYEALHPQRMVGRAWRRR